MFFRILKQSLLRQRGRKSLAVVAVLAGMTVATALLTIRVNVGDDLRHELRSDGANILVTPAADTLPLTLNGVDLRPARTGAYLREADVAKIKTIFWRHNVLAFAPLLFVRAHVNAQPIQVEGAWLDHDYTIPGTKGTRHTGLRELSPTWKVIGHWPGAGSTQVLAGVHTGFKVGDAITIAGPAAAIAATVRGVLRTGSAQDDELVVPLHLAQQLIGRPGAVRQILVSAITKPEDALTHMEPSKLTAAQAERWSCSPYAVTIARQLSQALPGAAAHPIRPVANSEGKILSKLSLLMLLIVLAALASSALAISSVMTAAVLERRREVAIMKAIGASDFAISSLFLIEAGAVGIAGGLGGYLLGELLANGISQHILGYAAAWKPALLPVILVLAAGVVIGGSAGALRRAALIDPAVILRGEA